LSPTYHLGDWLVEPDRHRIVREHEVKEIEPRHMRILVYLLAHPGKQVATTTLLQQAYSSKSASEDSLHIAIKHLREALGDTANRPRYIKEVPGKGYILVGKVHEDEVATKAPVAITWKLILAATLVATVVFLLQRQKASVEMVVEAPINSISMIPFRDFTGHEATQRLTKAVDANIRRRLSSLPNLKVVAWPETESQQLAHLAEELGVDAIVEGEVKVSEGKVVTLSAKISRVNPHRELFVRHVEGPLKNIQHMQQRLARELSAFLNAPGLPGKDGEETIPEAYEAFIEGYSLLDDRQYEAAIIHFENARTLSPNFAEPYLGLALAKTKLAQSNPLTLQKELDNLLELLNRAIELKPELAEAYTALGTLHFFYSWNFQAAEVNFKLALGKNPNDAAAHHRYAMFCVAFGRFDAAVEHLDLVRKLAPYTYSHLEVAFMHNIMGDFDNSEKELRLFADKDPTATEFIQSLLKLMENKGDEDRAFQCYEALFLRQGYTDEEMTKARETFATGGLIGLSRWLAFEKFEEHDVGQYEAPLAVARYLAEANQKKLAFDWLEKALEMKQTPLLWLNVDPKYDALRSDPRFGLLISRIGLDYTGSGDP